MKNSVFILPLSRDTAQYMESWYSTHTCSLFIPELAVSKNTKICSAGMISFQCHEKDINTSITGLSLNDFIALFRELFLTLNLTNRINTTTFSILSQKQNTAKSWPLNPLTLSFTCRFAITKFI